MFVLRLWSNDTLSISKDLLSWSMDGHFKKGEYPMTRNLRNTQVRFTKSFLYLDVMIVRDSYPPSHSKFEVVKPVDFEETDGDIIAEPTIRLPLECGQSMIDDLWSAGYRPSQGVSSTGQDDARKSHIDDLRSIVRSLLKIGSQQD